MCYSSFVSVVLTCPLFLQISNTLRNCKHAWQQQVEIQLVGVALGCGSLRSYWISHQKPISFFLSEILYETCFSAHPVLIALEILSDANMKAMQVNG